MKKLICTLMLLMPLAVFAASETTTLLPLTDSDKALIESNQADLIDILMRDYNRNSYVAENGEYILFEFATSWCGYCKKFAPVLDELAVAQKGTVNVVTIDQTSKRSDGAYLKKKLVVDAYPGEKTNYIPYFLLYKFDSSSDSFVQIGRGIEAPLRYMYDNNLTSPGFDKVLKELEIVK